MVSGKFVNLYTLPLLLCTGIFSCSAVTITKTEQAEVQPTKEIGMPVLTERQEPEQKHKAVQQEGTVKYMLLM